MSVHRGTGGLPHVEGWNPNIHIFLLYESCEDKATESFVDNRPHSMFYQNVVEAHKVIRVKWSP